MRPTTPYSADLGDRDPLDAIRENLDRVRTLTGGWTEAIAVFPDGVQRIPIA